MWNEGSKKVQEEMDLTKIVKTMLDLKMLLKNQKVNNIGFMQEINRCENDLIYVDDDEEI